MLPAEIFDFERRPGEIRQPLNDQQLNFEQNVGNKADQLSEGDKNKSRLPPPTLEMYHSRGSQRNQIYSTRQNSASVTKHWLSRPRTTG